MKTFEVEMKAGVPFEVRAASVSVQNETCVFTDQNGNVLAVIPLSNLLYIKEKETT